MHHWAMKKDKKSTDTWMLYMQPIKTSHIRHLCRKTTVLSSHRYLINTTVEKMTNIKIWTRVLTTRCLWVKGNVGIPTIVYIF